MEEITKEGAARCDRATPARKTGQPARGSRNQSIAQKHRRAKRQRRRLALLLVLVGLVGGTVYAIATWAGGKQPEAVPATTITPQTTQPVTQPPAAVATATQQMEAEDLATRYALTSSERDLTERVVMGEAGGESFEGQMLVAQCILNAAEKTGTAPSEVVTTYKYTKGRPEPTQSVKDAVAAVFDDGETIAGEPVMYFYNPARVTSKWHESQIFVTEVGGHRFFAEKGATQK